MDLAAFNLLTLSAFNTLTLNGFHEPSVITAITPELAPNRRRRR